MGKNKVLIAIDEPELFELIINTACSMFKPENTELYFINVLETTLAEQELFLRDSAKFIEHEARKKEFENAKELAEGKGFVLQEFIYTIGKASDEILRIESEKEIDLIVLGSENKTVMEKILLGSTSYKVLKQSKASVLVVKKPIRRQEKIRLLYTTDGSEYAFEAGKKLARLCDCVNFDITILNSYISLDKIIPNTTYENMDLTVIKEKIEEIAKNITQRAQDVLKDENIEIKEKLYIEGNPAYNIMEEISKKDYELVALGSHGKNVLEKFMVGSVSTKVFEHANTNVIVLKV